MKGSRVLLEELKAAEDDERDEHADCGEVVGQVRVTNASRVTLSIHWNFLPVSAVATGG